MAAKPLNDESIMPFGKHKGNRLDAIPHGWWIWMYDHKKLKGQYKEYAERTVPILRIQAEQERRKNDYFE